MSERPSDRNFYADLPAFSAFEDFVEFDQYAPVPGDWVVLSGDIRGSTQAIADGRYKAVNMVGAAVITSVLNACGDVSVPYVFGGDGGAVVVPPHLAEAGVAALQGLQAHSRQVFRLDLRAAAVQVSRIRAEGKDLRVRRFALNGSNHLALFSGGGIEHVDTILKSDPPDPAVLVSPEGIAPPDLEGLTCRWEPLIAAHGNMIALMVLPVGDEPERDVYQDVVAQLSDALDQDIPAHAPAKDASLRLGWPQSGLGTEARALALKIGRWKAWSWTLLTSILQKISHWRGSQIGEYDAPRYVEELKRQTDFRKYDGCLRTVLDCSAPQLQRIETWLAEQHAKGRLIYGLHRDDAALMTCIVFSLENSEHIHFVDAAGGGFAKAAIGFKQQLAAHRAS